MTNEAAFLEELAVQVGSLTSAASDAERASLEAVLTPSAADPRSGTSGDPSAQSGVGQIAEASLIARGAVTATSIAVGTIDPTHMSGDPKNLVPNAGCGEYVGGSTTVVRGWTLDAQCTRRVGSLMRSGNAVFQAIATVAATYNAAVTDYLPVSGARRYRGRVWLSGYGTNAATAQGALQVSWYDSAKSLISSSVIGTLTKGTSTVFGEIVGTATAPATAVWARVLAIASGTVTLADRLYWDDFELALSDQDIDHASGDILIDKSGITITNGKLTFGDEFGTTVLNGSGFGASWDDFVANNLYNCYFYAGANAASLPTGRTATLPYWTVSKAGSPTIKTEADTAMPGGRRVVFSPATVTDTLTLLSDLVPVQPGMTVTGGLVTSCIAIDAGKGMSIDETITFYKADGTTTTGTVDQSLQSVSYIATAATAFTYGFGTVSIPLDARFAKVKAVLDVYVGSNPITACTVYLGAIVLLPLIDGMGLNPNATNYGVTKLRAFDMLVADGGMRTKYKAGTFSDADFTDDADGNFGFDGTNHRLYFREGGVFHYIDRTAGFGIPVDVDGVDERICPRCGAEMQPGEPVAGILDGHMSDGALHGVWCHFRCAGSLP